MLLILCKPIEAEFPGAAMLPRGICLGRVSLKGLFVVQPCIREICGNAQFFIGCLAVFLHLLRYLVKEIVAVAVHIHHEGAQLVKLEMPGGFDRAHLLKKIHTLNGNGIDPKEGTDTLGGYVYTFVLYHGIPGLGAHGGLAADEL